MAVSTKDIRLMVGSGVDGSTFAHGTQALEWIALAKECGLTTRPIGFPKTASVANEIPSEFRPKLS